MSIEITTLMLDEQEAKYRGLDDWFKTAQGIRVGKAFASELHTLGEMLHGDRLLQFGSCGNNVWLTALQYRHKWLTTPYETQSTSLVTALNGLPIERSSIDCVIAPLALEAFGHDKNPMDEIDRILKPMGYVVFFGINPWSFWGAALRLRGIHCFGHNTFGKLTSSLFLTHEMSNRGYTQCALNSFYYIPPVANKNVIHKLEFFNEMGKMIWPFPAGFYCYIAQKYQPISPTLLFDPFDDVRLVAS